MMDPVEEAAVARGREMGEKLVANRDAMFRPMREVIRKGGKDALAVAVLQTQVEVLADYQSTRGRQYRPDLPLYHPMWEIMLLGGGRGMVACALGVQLAVITEFEKGGGQ